jgi:death-on-curing protein
MAAAYFFSLTRNHAFNDGNKRTALSATTTFLQLNEIALETDEDELVYFTMRVATENVRI